MKKVLATSLITLGLAAALPSAFAQTAGPAGDTAQAQSQSAHRSHERRAVRSPSDRMEARLAYIRTALKITPAQETQWNAYAEMRRNHANALDKRFEERRAQMKERGAERRRPTAIERHERQRDFMLSASKRMDELLSVEKPLYAALTPEQQRVADDVLVTGGERRHGRGHHRGRHGRA